MLVLRGARGHRAQHEAIGAASFPPAPSASDGYERGSERRRRHGGAGQGGGPRAPQATRIKADTRLVDA